jgi:hypothetical protein
MATKDKLAFLKAHLEELSPNILRQLKEEIVVQKKKKAAVEAFAKSQGSGQQPGSAREETKVSQQKPETTADKPTSTELDSSNSGGSMEPTARRSAPGKLSGAESAPLPAPVKAETFTGE